VPSRIKPDCSYIFLSHGGNGGIPTHQAHQISYLISNKKHVALIDNDPNITLARIDNLDEFKEYLIVINSLVWKNVKGTSLILERLILDSKSSFVIINNPSLLIKYFFTFLRFRVVKKCKLILTLHSSISFENRKLNGIGELIISFTILGLVNRINYVSAFTKDYWQNTYRWMRLVHSSCVTNGILSFKNVLPKPPRENVHIGYVGRFSDEKNPLLFCAIARLAYSRGVNFKFYMYGEGPILPLIQACEPPNLTIIGWAEESLIYENIDLLVVTSFVENSPYVILEAKNYGVPSVAGRVGGIAEILSNNYDGLLIDELDPAYFLDGIEKVIQSHSTYSSACLDSRYRFNAQLLSGEIWNKLH